jgi:hypothetical protein
MYNYDGKNLNYLVELDVEDCENISEEIRVLLRNGICYNNQYRLMLKV